MNEQPQLLAVLSNLLPSATSWLLGIDGEQRVGKTTLADDLASKLGAAVLHCDDFVENGRLAYPNALALQKLSAAVTKLRASGTSVIIEGVMLRLVLDAMQLQPNSVVYVRHVHPDGTLAHAHLFDSEKLQTAIEEDTKFDATFFPNRKYSSLAREIFDYHQQRRPADVSDHVFDNRFDPVQ
jgi:2-phosphoglycerate kinase